MTLTEKGVFKLFGDKRKRKRSFFDDIFEEMRAFMEEFEKMMFEDFDEIEKLAPRIRTPSGMEVRGPFVWGWSVTIGPDGKPIVREFGNVPREEKLSEEKEAEKPAIQPIREPLVDVFEDDERVTVIAELPGVEKDEIEVDSTGDELIIKASDKYYKKLKLPSEVKPEEAKTSYRNGILEIILPKVQKGKGKKGYKIKIE